MILNLVQESYLVFVLIPSLSSWNSWNFLGRENYKGVFGYAEEVTLDCI